MVTLNIIIFLSLSKKITSPTSNFNISKSDMIRVSTIRKSSTIQLCCSSGFALTLSKNKENINNSIG